MVWGSRFSVHGSRSTGCSLGFMFWGSLFTVHGLGFAVHSSGFMSLSPEAFKPWRRQGFGILVFHLGELSRDGIPQVQQDVSIPAHLDPLPKFTWLGLRPAAISKKGLLLPHQRLSPRLRLRKGLECCVQPSAKDNVGEVFRVLGWEVSLSWYHCIFSS
jgi:hypothetical protein